MKNSKNKTLAILIAAILTISIGASLIMMPNVSAHSPSWTIVDYAYLAVAPNPVGVNQPVAIYMWV